MSRSQHFGYYDANHTSEQTAQIKYHEEFAKFLRLKPGMKLLDAGCGQGVVACYLSREFGVDVTGITITPYEVKVAKRRASRAGVSKKTRFLLADYANPPFAEGVFDRIYTTETLSHAMDVSQVMAGFMRLLKPGGMIVCAEYEMDHKNFNQEVREGSDFVKRHAAIHGMYQFGKGEFVSAIRKAGFSDITETDWTLHLKPSFDRLRRLAVPIAKITKHSLIKPFFVNSHAAKLYADGVEQGVFAYKVYTAIKPE
jgi:cyclopropane fatty-acyl-phospholipid synthase-like methyltransferase